METAILAKTLDFINKLTAKNRAKIVSVVLVGWKEDRTVGKAVKSFIEAFKIAGISPTIYEIIVIAPDKPTQDAAKKIDINVKILQDDNRGKPVALNKAFAEAKGQFLILSDSDVYVDKFAIREMLPHAKEENIGLICGHPIPQNKRGTMMGYWGHLLTHVGAHTERSYKQSQGEFMEASGYLYALRKPQKTALPKLPEDALSDDALISHFVHTQNYRIVYEPKAKVYVKFPTTLRDWLKQKRRSAGGHNQIEQYYQAGALDINKKPKLCRTFWREVSYFFEPFKFAKNTKEFIWTLALYPARLWLWTLIFWDINLGHRKKLKKGLWERIETTK